MPTVRVDDQVWRELQLRATAFKDTPNTTLRRVLKIDTNDLLPTGKTLFDLMIDYLIAPSTRAKSATMKEIRRRFVIFGWMPGKPNK